MQFLRNTVQFYHHNDPVDGVYRKYPQIIIYDWCSSNYWYTDSPKGEWSPWICILYEHPIIIIRQTNKSRMIFAVVHAATHPSYLNLSTSEQLLNRGNWQRFALSSTKIQDPAFFSRINHSAEGLLTIRCLCSSLVGIHQWFLCDSTGYPCQLRVWGASCTDQAGYIKPMCYIRSVANPPQTQQSKFAAVHSQPLAPELVGKFQSIAEDTLRGQRKTYDR